MILIITDLIFCTDNCKFGHHINVSLDLVFMNARDGFLAGDK